MKYYGVVWSYGNNDQLEHFGIKGQRWGVRRWQNEDGTLTEEGKKRYTYSDGRQSKMNLAGRLKFGKKYADDYNKNEKAKTMGNMTKQEYDEKAKKDFDKLSAEEDKLLALNKRMDSFDKASADEKLKIIDEADQMQTELLRKYGSGSAEFEGLNDWWRKNRTKAGEAKFKELDALPKGQDRNNKLTKLLEDSDKEGQDSIYVDALIDRMQERHGDYLSGEFKNESSRKIIDEFGEADRRAEELRKKYYLEDQKRGIYPKDKYGTGWTHREKIAEDHPEVRESMNARDSKWNDYCAQVLKDMGMPVNDKTIEYIQHVIIWN